MTHFSCIRNYEVEYYEGREEEGAAYILVSKGSI